MNKRLASSEESLNSYLREEKRQLSAKSAADRKMPAESERVSQFILVIVNVFYPVVSWCLRVWNWHLLAVLRWAEEAGHSGAAVRGVGLAPRALEDAAVGRQHHRLVVGVGDHEAVVGVEAVDAVGSAEVPPLLVEDALAEEGRALVVADGGVADALDAAMVAAGTAEAALEHPRLIALVPLHLGGAPVVARRLDVAAVAGLAPRNGAGASADIGGEEDLVDQRDLPVARVDALDH
mmetsp:Transcript_19558/g.41189  ORF Transcript_19558/g.41189 Transcript_19558/m.41189 type:complete len:236 (+) Transcript_19558:552-1259(+)